MSKQTYLSGHLGLGNRTQHNYEFSNYLFNFLDCERDFDHEKNGIISIVSLKRANCEEKSLCKISAQKS